MAADRLGALSGVLHFHFGHHTWQQFAMGVADADADVIGVRHGVGLHAFLNGAALEGAADGFDVYGCGRVAAEGCHLALGHGNLHLDAADVEDADDGLRGQRCLAGLHEALAYDAAHGSFQAAVGHVAACDGELGAGLIDLALHLHPLCLGHRALVVEELVARQGVLGLPVLCLGGSEHVAGLCVVEFGDELSAAYGLSFAHGHALQRTHRGVADDGRLVLFDDADIRAALSRLGIALHDLRLHAYGLLLPLLCLLAAGRHQQGQQPIDVSCCFHFCYV